MKKARSIDKKYHKITKDYDKQKSKHLEPVSYTHLPSPRDRQKSRMPSSA